MSNFPLYDTLIKDAENEDLTTKEKNEFMEMIKVIDENGTELLYVLIMMYNLENNEDKTTYKIPYGGKYVENDISFNLNDFPFQLKQMLYNFLKLHTKTMKESSSNEDNDEDDDD